MIGPKHTLESNFWDVMNEISILSLRILRDPQLLRGTFEYQNVWNFIIGYAYLLYRKVVQIINPINPFEKKFFLCTEFIDKITL